MARLRPTTRATSTIGVVQKRPMRTPGVAKSAPSEATARSQAATSWHPAAVATPCTRATTGCGMSWRVSMSSEHAANTSTYSSSSRPTSSRRSWPAQKAGPAAPKTSARTDGSPASSSSAAVSSRISSSDSGFRRSGRFSTRVATAPSRSLRRASDMPRQSTPGLDGPRWWRGLGWLSSGTTQGGSEDVDAVEFIRDVTYEMCDRDFDLDLVESTFADDFVHHGNGARTDKPGYLARGREYRER